MVSPKFTVILAVLVVFAFVQSAAGSPAIGKKYGNVRTTFCFSICTYRFVFCGWVWNIECKMVVICVLFQRYYNKNMLGASADLMGGFDFLGVCIRNCAQCKKMYGAYFEGQLCADACVKYKGKIIPDCEDIGSIAPFLNKFE